MFEQVTRPTTEGRAKNVPCNFLTFEHNGVEFAVSLEIDGGRRQDREELRDTLLNVLQDAMKKHGSV